MNYSRELAELALDTSGTMPIEFIIFQRQIEKTLDNKVKTTKALKDATRKTERKVYELLSYTDNTGMLFFNKMIYSYYENWETVFDYIYNMSDKIIEKQVKYLTCIYRTMNTTITDISMFSKFCSTTQDAIKQEVILLQKKPTSIETLKSLLDIDQEFEEEVDKQFFNDNSLDKIIERKYISVEGVGLVPKSMMESKIPILIPNGYEGFKKKK